MRITCEKRSVYSNVLCSYLHSPETRSGIVPALQVGLPSALVERSRPVLDRMV